MERLSLTFSRVINIEISKNNQHNIATTTWQWLYKRVNSFLLSSKSPEQSGESSDPLLFWMPMVWCIVVISLLLSLSTIESDEAIKIATLVVLASISLGWLVHRRHMQITQDLLRAQKKTKSKESNFYGQIFPIWSKQINTSRTEGDKAAHQLTALFSEIVSKLEGMLKESRMGLQSGQGHEKGLIDAVTSSQVDIRTAFKDLKEALEVVNDSKDMLLAEVTMYSANMKEMAVESNHVAFQSQIIALNAKIEAACAGETGRAFAAVVSEMSELARQSTETSKNIAQKADSIDSAMAKFYSNDKEMEIKEAAQVTSAENMFNDIVERFNQVTTELEKSINSMEIESSHIRDDISNALVELQFQDRVSQIMAHVADNIIDLQEHTKTEVHHLDADIWLNEMKAQFSVDQEHGSLGGKKTTMHSNPLTFF